MIELIKDAGTAVAAMDPTTEYLKQSFYVVELYDCTIELIQDIGKVVSAVDSSFEYIKRSFCILELYAAFQGNTNLMCLNSLKDYKKKNDMRKVLAIDDR